MTFRLIQIAIFFILSIGCTKLECVKTAAPEMVGEWSHFSQNNGFHNISILPNGKGSLYGNNDHGNSQDTRERKWFIKDAVLYFSRFANNRSSEMFTIDMHPTIADTNISVPYNSIPAGKTYMILNGRIYIKVR